MSSNFKNIMVVDDYPLNVLLVVRALEKIYNVTCADSGSQCLSLMKKNKPDLILMDVRMPGMDGYECCKIIKSTPAYEDIPIIFLSAHFETADKLNGYKSGGDDYLAKPCNLEELKAKIKHNFDIIDKFKSKIISSPINKIYKSNLSDFTSSSFNCQTKESLAELILDTLSFYKLNAVVQLRGVSDSVTLATHKHCAPLEESFMSTLDIGYHLSQMGSKLLCNSSHVSLVVKNLPYQDQEFCQQITGDIMSIINGANAKMKSLNVIKSINRF
jgi:CheY-like chemotaxis protein